MAVECTCNNNYWRSPKEELVEWAILTIPFFEDEMYGKPWAKLHTGKQ